MDAITLLKNQHREVEELFSKFEKLADEGANAEKKAIVAEIALKLSAHAEIEERFFYPEGREADEDLTLEAYEEHGLVKDLLKKIGKSRMNDESLKAKMTVLKEIVEHHVEEEEDEYFPECEKTLGDERLEELGTEMEAAFERYVASGGRKNPRKRVAKAKTGAKKRRKVA